MKNLDHQRQKEKKRTESSKRTYIIYIRSDVKGDVTGFKEFYEFWYQSKEAFDTFGKSHYKLLSIQLKTKIYKTIY